MSRLLRFITKMPLPPGTKLGWQRLLLDRAFAQDISAARKAKDTAKVQSLESDRRFEIDMHDEEEDAYVTKQPLKKVWVPALTGLVGTITGLVALLGHKG